MQERTIDIDTGEGAMETFITQPEAGGPFPAVIVYMDIWGCAKSFMTSPGVSPRPAIAASSPISITARGASASIQGGPEAN